MSPENKCLKTHTKHTLFCGDIFLIDANFWNHFTGSERVPICPAIEGRNEDIQPRRCPNLHSNCDTSFVAWESSPREKEKETRRERRRRPPREVNNRRGSASRSTVHICAVTRSGQLHSRSTRSLPEVGRRVYVRRLFDL
jgi:hypothetical protein